MGGMRLWSSTAAKFEGTKIAVNRFACSFSVESENKNIYGVGKEWEVGVYAQL